MLDIEIKSIHKGNSKWANNRKVYFVNLYIGEIFYQIELDENWKPYRVPWYWSRAKANQVADAAAHWTSTHPLD